MELLNTLIISEPNLTVEQLAFTEYSDVFALDIPELGLTDFASHTINTGDNPPYDNSVR